MDGSRGITYSKCLNVVKSKGLDPSNYALHSCLSGAATNLASRVTPFELLVSGRWADCRSLNNYVEISVDCRYKISENLFL